MLESEGSYFSMSFNSVLFDEDFVSGSRVLHRPLTVAVEGNIGCGKSTFLDYCREKSGVVVYPEPVGEWQNVNGFNLLVSIFLIC